MISNSTTLELNMGNLLLNKTGISGFTLKDLRLWSNVVSEEETYSWRHRQLDVNNFRQISSNSKYLMAYYRLAEGDHSYYNLVNFK